MKVFPRGYRSIQTPGQLRTPNSDSPNSAFPPPPLPKIQTIPDFNPPNSIKPLDPLQASGLTPPPQILALPDSKSPFRPLPIQTLPTQTPDAQV